MCKAYENTKKVINEYIRNKKEFSLNELKNAIINNNGVLRVASTVTLKEYLEFLVYLNLISQKDDKFIVNKKY